MYFIFVFASSGMRLVQVSLMDTDLRKLAKAIMLGRLCRRKIKQNICISVVSKVAVAVIGSFSLISTDRPCQISRSSVKQFFGQLSLGTTSSG